jgi:hypothetical protein
MNACRSRIEIAALVAWLLQAGVMFGATTIEVSNTVTVPAVKRFGVNLGDNNYWDSPMVKNLFFDNPGFEGLLYRSVVQCASGAANGCTDNLAQSVWPSGFWNAASYEFIWGTAKGRSGTVVSSTAPSAGSGTSYVFADSSSAPSAGDYMVLRRFIAGTAERDWFTERLSGGTVSTELNDLPPETQGKQAIRLSAMNGGTAAITGPLDNHSNGPFLQLNGTFRLAFKGKGAGGSNTLNVSLRRGGSANSTFINQALVLGSSWSTYNFDFAAAENGLQSDPSISNFPQQADRRCSSTTSASFKPTAIQRIRPRFAIRS